MGETPRRFAVDFICCGYDDGTAIRDTWEEADALRESYVAAEGHQRSAILREAKPDEVQRVERIPRSRGEARRNG